MLNALYAECLKYALNAECLKYARNAECRYAECHYAECRGTLKTQMLYLSVSSQ
jgi:hypothetical protein